MISSKISRLDFPYLAFGSEIWVIFLSSNIHLHTPAPGTRLLSALVKQLLLWSTSMGKKPLNYSVKNKPVAAKNMKRMMEKVESLVRRMRCLNRSQLSDILPYPLFHCHIRLPVIRVCFTVCLMSKSFWYLQPRPATHCVRIFKSRLCDCRSKYMRPDDCCNNATWNLG